MEGAFNSIILLLILTAAALGIVWLLFYKLYEKSTDNKSDIDKDLIKIKEHVRVDNHRGYIFGIAIFVVSIFIWKLVLSKKEIIHEVAQKKKPTFVNDIDEVELPPIDIPEPEPPKPQVVLTPKVVPDDVVLEVKKDTIKEVPDDFFDDEDEDEDPLPPEEKKEGPPPIYGQTEVGAEFLNGGDGGLENTIILLLESKLPNFDPGFYPIPLEFVVELNGKVSSVYIEPGREGEIENMEIAKLVMGALKNAGKWTPGMQDGQYVRTRMQRPFFIDIQ